MEILYHFFDPDSFDIEINQYEDGEAYIIHTKDGRQCLDIALDKFDEKTIYVNRLDKCNSNGKLLLQILEEYARSLGIHSIMLQDGSEIITECFDETGRTIRIDLAILKLIINGKSWYNSLGYLSRDEKRNIDEIVQLSCIDAIHLSEFTQTEKAKNVFLANRRTISAHSHYRKKINEIKTETRELIDRADKLFHDIKLTLSVREYLTTILPGRFEDNCDSQKYKFIEDFINQMAVIINYDVNLTKKLGGRKRRTRRMLK